jgi:hypothetical protein
MGLKLSNSLDKNSINDPYSNSNSHIMTNKVSSNLRDGNVYKNMSNDSLNNTKNFGEERKYT